MEMEITFPGGARVDAHMGHLVVETNQDGSAPAPFGLFLASIGTCAGIYVLSFLQHRGLPTDGVKVVQRVHTNPATRMVGQVDLDIVVPPDFPEKYHSALVRAANQCAVKKHLEQPPVFNVQTKVGAGVA
ncbi:MAG: OsmC family protein [Gemmatimonadota bacterium]|nr:OsmC family protein [Gemmatimonadota bacterium]MDH5759974.1 OsmC family protein [Gemmatimonadota bacterium]